MDGRNDGITLSSLPIRKSGVILQQHTGTPHFIVCTGDMKPKWCPIWLCRKNFYLYIAFIHKHSLRPGPALPPTSKDEEVEWFWLLTFENEVTEEVYTPIPVFVSTMDSKSMVYLLDYLIPIIPCLERKVVPFQYNPQLQTIEPLEPISYGGHGGWEKHQPKMQWPLLIY